MAETLMLGLRLTEGIDRAGFRLRFGIDALEAFGRSITRHADDGFLVVSGSAIRLSAKALFVADTILADILADAGMARAPVPKGGHIDVNRAMVLIGEQNTGRNIVNAMNAEPTAERPQRAENPKDRT